MHPACVAWCEGAWDEALSYLPQRHQKELREPKSVFPAPFTIMIEDMEELRAAARHPCMVPADESVKVKLEAEYQRITKMENDAILRNSQPT